MKWTRSKRLTVPAMLRWSLIPESAIKCPIVTLSIAIWESSERNDNFDSTWPNARKTVCCAALCEYVWSRKSLPSSRRPFQHASMALDRATCTAYSNIALTHISSQWISHFPLRTTFIHVYGSVLIQFRKQWISFHCDNGTDVARWANDSFIASNSVKTLEMVSKRYVMRHRRTRTATTVHRRTHHHHHRCVVNSFVWIFDVFSFAGSLSHLILIYVETNQIK